MGGDMEEEAMYELKRVEVAEAWQERVEAWQKQNQTAWADIDKIIYKTPFYEEAARELTKNAKMEEYGLSAVFVQCEMRINGHEMPDAQDRWLPIHTAIKHGDCETIRRLMMCGASLNMLKRGRWTDGLHCASTLQSALHLICETDGEGCPMLKAALSALTQSIDVNVMSYTEKDDDADFDVFGHPGIQETNALSVALQKRNVEMVKL